MNHRSVTAPQADAAMVRRARRQHRVLADTYPDARCELDHRNPFELLVATVLSAQTTDVRVNEVSGELFARWPTPVAMAGASREELESVIRPTGFFRAKAGHLLGLSAALVDAFDSEVPADLDALVSLPGVGRKTANVVLGNAFGVPGITVDTHVARVTRRLGWITPAVANDPVKAEHAIGALFPPRDWTMLCHRLIFHGRRCCFARRPACAECPVRRTCPSAEVP